MYRLAALILLATVSFALDPYDFLPCSFQATTLTHIYSGGAEIATSEDALYRDHDNLWRWESDFSGLSGLFDPHMWVIVWRPDNAASYHHNMLAGTCLKNNGGKTMYPYPVEWISGKLDSITWTDTEITFNDKPAVMYTAKGKSTQYKFDLVANLMASKSGQLLGGNGTVKSMMIDVEYTMDVDQFISNSPVSSKLFQTTEPCPEVTIPAEPSKDWSKMCYKKQPLPGESSSNAGFAVIPSILAVIFAVLMCIAL